jgi:hypothetical protein
MAGRVKVVIGPWSFVIGEEAASFPNDFPLGENILKQLKSCERVSDILARLRLRAR